MAGDELVPEADLTDISAGGCCLRLAWLHCAGLRKGMALEEFHLLHEDLPKDVLRGRVRWVLGRAAAGRSDPPFGLVGVEFEPPPEAAIRQLVDFVARQLGTTSSSPGSEPP
jgi:c-di-GMP-binding flagellar brake protein YcgR